MYREHRVVAPEVTSGEITDRVQGRSRGSAALAPGSTSRARHALRVVQSSRRPSRGATGTVLHQFQRVVVPRGEGELARFVALGRIGEIMRPIRARAAAVSVSARTVSA